MNQCHRTGLRGFSRESRLLDQGDGCLAGITRDVIIDIDQQMGISCDQTSLTVEGLQQADECFLTGTGAELIKVSQIEQHVYKTPANPLMPKIKAAFQNRINLICQEQI